MTTDIFESCVRSRGDLAGVFEYDGETGYFYLYENTNDANRKVVDAIHIVSGQVDLEESGVSVRWDTSEGKVGLFIRGALWAVFDARRREKHGGGYQVGAKPSITSSAAEGFSP